MSSQNNDIEAQYRHEGAGVVEERPGLLESSNIEPLDHMKGSGYPVESGRSSRTAQQGKGQKTEKSASGSQLKQKPSSQTDTRNLYK